MTKVTLTDKNLISQLRERRKQGESYAELSNESGVDLYELISIINGTVDPICSCDGDDECSCYENTEYTPPLTTEPANPLKDKTVYTKLTEKHELSKKEMKNLFNFDSRVPIYSWESLHNLDVRTVFNIRQERKEGKSYTEIAENNDVTPLDALVSARGHADHLLSGVSEWEEMVTAYENDFIKGNETLEELIEYDDFEEAKNYLQNEFIDTFETESSWDEIVSRYMNTDIEQFEFITLFDDCETLTEVRNEYELMRESIVDYEVVESNDGFEIIVDDTLVEVESPFIDDKPWVEKELMKWLLYETDLYFIEMATLMGCHDETARTWATDEDKHNLNSDSNANLTSSSTAKKLQLQSVNNPFEGLGS